MPYRIRAFDGGIDTLVSSTCRDNRGGCFVGERASSPQLLQDQKDPDCKGVIADLREQIQQIPTDSFNIHKHMPEIEEAWTDAFWDYLIPSKIEFLKLKVAPHLRLVPGVDVAAATFISKVERLELLKRTGKEASGTIQAIVEDAQSLRDTILSDAEIKAKSMCVPEKLVEFSSNELNLLRDVLSPCMKNKMRYDSFLELDLLDSIAISGYGGEDQL